MKMFPQVLAVCLGALALSILLCCSDKTDRSGRRGGLNPSVVGTVTGCRNTYVMLNRDPVVIGGMIRVSSSGIKGTFVMDGETGECTWFSGKEPPAGHVDDEGRAFYLDLDGNLVVVTANGGASLLPGFGAETEDCSLYGVHRDAAGKTTFILHRDDYEEVSRFERWTEGGTRSGVLSMDPHNGLDGHQLFDLSIQSASVIWVTFRTSSEDQRTWLWRTYRGDFDTGTWTSHVEGAFHVIDSAGTLLEMRDPLIDAGPASGPRTRISPDGRKTLLKGHDGEDFEVLFGGRYAWRWDPEEAAPTVFPLKFE